jgi:hypothetical protein
MPEKETLQLGKLPKKSVGVTGTFERTEIWGPLCGMTDTFTSDVIPPLYAADDTVAEIGTDSKWIVYANSRFTRMNPCHHLKSSCDFFTGSYLILDARRHFEDWEYEDECDYPWVTINDTRKTVRVGGITNLYASTLGFGEVMKDDPYLFDAGETLKAKLQVLDRIALDTMIPQLDDGWSAPRALFELIELKQLFAHAKQLLLQCRGLVEQLFKKPLKEISNQFLAGIFGWLPFVDDIKTFVTKYQNVADDVFEFLENANKRQTLHFQKALSPLTFQDASWFDDREGSITIDTSDDEWEFADGILRELVLKTAYTREVKQLTYHMTLEFSYSVPGIPGGIQQFLAELDYWGINFSISDVWEVIPFSFVVDWFWNVGAWLEKFDFENLPVSVNIHDCCRSVKGQLLEELKVTDLESITLDAPGWTTYVPSEWTMTPALGRATRVTHLYHRWPGLPVPSAEQLPNWRTPKGLTWVIGAALLGTRQSKI